MSCIFTQISDTVKASDPRRRDQQALPRRWRRPPVACSEPVDGWSTGQPGATQSRAKRVCRRERLPHSRVNAPPPMSDAANRIVPKLWSYYNVLRDAGLSCLDYLPPRSNSRSCSSSRWPTNGSDSPASHSRSRPGTAGRTSPRRRWRVRSWNQHYRETLRVLGTRGGMLGLIFEKAQNRIQDPALLRNSSSS